MKGWDKTPTPAKQVIQWIAQQGNMELSLLLWELKLGTTTRTETSLSLPIQLFLGVEYALVESTNRQQANQPAWIVCQATTPTKAAQAVSRHPASTSPSSPHL